MKTPRLPLLVLALAASLSAARGATSGGPAATPVILVTDIGTDIDDSWAIALLLRSRELDLKLVVVDPADTQYRAAVAAKLLEESGRADVPVAIGDNSGPMGDDNKTLKPWIAGYDIGKYPG